MCGCEWLSDSVYSLSALQLPASGPGGTPPHALAAEIKDKM